MHFPGYRFKDYNNIDPHWINKFQDCQDAR